MNDRQVQLAGLILNNDLKAEADADNFAAVVAALNAKTVVVTKSTPVSMAETGMALGADATEALEAFHKTPIGQSAVAKLAAEGLQYNHPLTVNLLDNLVAASLLRPEIADKLKSLSEWCESPFERDSIAAAGVDELRAAWNAYRLDQKLTNAAAKARESITAEMNEQERAAAWTAAWEAV